MSPSTPITNVFVSDTVYKMMLTTFLDGLEAWHHWFLREQQPRHLLMPGNPKPHATFPHIPLDNLLQRIEKVVSAVAIVDDLSAVCKLCASIQVHARHITKDHIKHFDAPFCDREPNDQSYVNIYRIQVVQWNAMIVEQLCFIKSRVHVYHLPKVECGWN